MIKEIYKMFVSIILWPIWFLYLIIILPVFLIYISILNKKYFHLFLRPMSFLFCLFGGQLVRLRGVIPNPNDGPYLYLINHQSLFDHFVLGVYLKHYVTAVAKYEQFSYPLWGHVAKKYGIVPIHREKLKKALNSLKNVENLIINHNISFLIAPEGTRSINGELGEFKKGAFHIAKNTGIDIVPVIINGAYEAKNKLDWRLTPGKIEINFGKLIKSKDYNDFSIEELRDYVRSYFLEFVD